MRIIFSAWELFRPACMNDTKVLTWVTAGLDAVKGTVSGPQQCKGPIEGRQKDKKKEIHCGLSAAACLYIRATHEHWQVMSNRKEKQHTNCILLRSECWNAYHHDWQVYGDKTATKHCTEFCSQCWNCTQPVHFCQKGTSTKSMLCGLRVSAQMFYNK